MIELTGYWSSNHADGLDGPAETAFFFKADGTGRFEFENYVLNSADLFQWQVVRENILLFSHFRLLEIGDQKGEVNEGVSTFRSGK